MRLVSFVMLMLVSVTQALAQSGVAVKQSGNVTPGQVPWWITSGVIGGGVSSADSPVTSFGVTNNGGNGICANSDRLTAVGRNTICLGTTTNGSSFINVQNYGMALPETLIFNINGTPYQFPFTVGGIVGPGTTVVGDVATWANTNGTLLADTSPTNILPAGVDANVLNAQAGGYTVLTSDCKKTIQLSGSGVGITLPSVSGFPSTCGVTIVNSNATRGIALNGFPFILDSVHPILYPKQVLRVEIVNGAWAVTVNPGRWRLPGSVTLYINNATGDNSFDGLSASAPFFDFATAYSTLVNKFDFNTQTVTIQAAAGQTWGNTGANGGWTGGGRVVLDGGNGIFTAATGTAIGVENTQGSTWEFTFTIQNMTITCSGGANGFTVISGYGAIGSGVTFGACPGGNHILADGPSRIWAPSNYTINGAANSHLSAGFFGLIDFNVATTVTIVGNPAITQFASAGGLGSIVSSVTWSGTTVGNHFTAILNGVIQTNTGNCNTYFPGTIAGIIQTGGQCN